MGKWKLDYKWSDVIDADDKEEAIREGFLRLEEAVAEGNEAEFVIKELKEMEDADVDESSDQESGSGSEEEDEDQ
jgi:hypothetical protein